jgi:hypothetical protein
MARARKRLILAALGLAVALAGCASGPIIDGLPSNMGLPAGTPERPTTPYQYPAVHDMPPTRATPIMTEEQQRKLEKELTVLREQQEVREGTGKKTVQPAKTQPAAAEKAETAGAKTNP